MKTRLRHDSFNKHQNKFICHPNFRIRFHVSIKHNLYRCDSYIYSYKKIRTIGIFDLFLFFIFYSLSTSCFYVNNISWVWMLQDKVVTSQRYQRSYFHIVEIYLLLCTWALCGFFGRKSPVCLRGHATLHWNISKVIHIPMDK